MAIDVVDRTTSLAFRQRALHLHRRLPHEKFLEATFAGLQDSAPRSAVLALHARVQDISPSSWEDPKLAQIWGPRGAVFAVSKSDVAVFTIGRMPRDRTHQAAIEAAAKRVSRALVRRGAAKALDAYVSSPQHTHDLRTASITGMLRIRWDGSRISCWAVAPPTGDPEQARLELARRYLRSLGPSTPAGFA